MKTNPYSAYRGRKSWLRRILIAIVILLVIALAAALVGLVVLPNYVVYTPDGPRLVIPFFGSGGTATPAPVGTLDPLTTPGVTANPDDVVIESAKPSPSPSPTPRPEMSPRRDAPLGLVSYEWPRLLDGAAKESLARGRGAIFDAAGADLTDADLKDAVLDLPYAAALVTYDPADGDAVITSCQTLAGLGFDELILSPAEDVTPTEADTSRFYADLYAALKDDLGYEGRLSAVCSKETFTQGADAATGQRDSEVTRTFERVYVPGGNWGGFNLYKALKDMDFTGSTADIVTVVSKPISANYSWAILP